MLRVTTTDCEVFTGDNAKEIVRQMRNTQWGAPQPKRSYMVDVVERTEMMTGINMDPDAVLDDELEQGCEHFLIYLETVGAISIETGVTQ